MKRKWMQTVLALVLVFSATAALWAEGRLPATDMVKAQVTEWFRNNNKWGPDHQIVKDMSNQVGSDVDNVNLIELTIGSALTRDGKFFRLCCFGGQFFAFELTDAQAQELQAKPSSLGYSTGMKNRDMRETPPIAKLSDLTVNNAAALPGSSKVTGKVAIDVTGTLPASPALRLTWSADRVTRSTMIYPTFKAGAQTLEFSFKELNEEKEMQPTKGPIVLYMDLCTVKEVNGKVETNVLGNTVATVADVQ